MPMNTLGKQDVINGLKKCKRLAKQDLLASSLTSQPEFWNKQAEVRRQIYGELIEIVEKKGVEAATSYALKAFVKLSPDNDSPEVRGQRQALKMFFTILGMDERTALQEAKRAVGMETSSAVATQASL
jgi:hypothetical protein